LDGRRCAELKLVLPWDHSRSRLRIFIMARHLAPARLTFACAPEVSPPNEELGVLKQLHRDNDRRRETDFDPRLHRRREPCCSRKSLSEWGPAGRFLSASLAGWHALDSESSCHREVFSKSFCELVTCFW
jgi:hypothetical protein